MKLLHFATLCQLNNTTTKEKLEMRMHFGWLHFSVIRLAVQDSPAVKQANKTHGLAFRPQKEYVLKISYGYKICFGLKCFPTAPKCFGKAIPKITDFARSCSLRAVRTVHV